MRKIVLLEKKATERADKAVLEVDEAVRECVTALGSGKVRPSISGVTHSVQIQIQPLQRGVVVSTYGT